jgi:chemotaxis protein MotB
VVGDRFVFQSEVLFGPASAELSDDAKRQLMPVAQALKDIAEKIPPDLNWVLRVDGHTDKRPISTPVYPSNWELSSARAISVVRFFMDQGISASHLVAAGFGEYQPLDAGGDEAAYRRNRRIELKLTER